MGGFVAHEPYDPTVHGTYGAYLRSKGIQVKGSRYTPVRREYRDEGGRVVRDVIEREPHGGVSITRNRTDSRGGDHQDVIVRPPVISVRMGVDQ